MVRQAETHGLSGPAIFHHYMKRLSQRGWAQFSVEHLDTAAGYARSEGWPFRLRSGAREPGWRRGLYMFEGWLEGALGYIMAGGSNRAAVKVSRGSGRRGFGEVLNSNQARIRQFG